MLCRRLTCRRAPLPSTAQLRVTACRRCTPPGRWPSSFTPVVDHVGCGWEARSGWRAPSQRRSASATTMASTLWRRGVVLDRGVGVARTGAGPELVADGVGRLRGGILGSPVGVLSLPRRGDGALSPALRPAHYRDDGGFQHGFLRDFLCPADPRRYHRGGGWDPVGAQQLRRGPRLFDAMSG